ncbi:MAG: leucine-rich repeat protein [Clostridia bacterium]|nr:leucine-rich repeat protein [Clostridia bacterium]
MLKKLTRSALALVLCLSLLITPVGVFAESTAGEEVPQIKAFEEETPEIVPHEYVRGTTPRPNPSSRPGDVGTLAETITPAMKSTAEGVYEALLAAPLEIFDWTSVGIAESTRMSSMTELEYVSGLALELTEDCTTTDEKIYVLAEYLAKNIGYDYDYYVHGTQEYPPIDPYTVLSNGYTVCSGYAKTYEAMLQSLGIPCIYVYSPDHEWSAVHNGERWMLIDVTWMSNSIYEYGELRKSETINNDWYDFTIDKALSNYNHVIEEMALGVVDGVLTAYPVYSELSYIYWPDGITGIDDHVFRERDHFTGSLTIPDTVKTIGYAAFYECDGFTGGLTLPSALVSVGEVAFYECDGFTGSLTFGTSLKTVGPWAFASASFAGDLILPDSLEQIEENAFYYGQFTGKLDLGDGVQYIGEDAFAGGTLFRGDLIIPDSTTYVGALSFAYCTFDGVIKLGRNLKEVGKYAFYGCEQLTGDLIIPDSVTKIGEGSFSFIGIDGDIVVGCGITDIPLDAFYAIQYAEGDIFISENVKTIGERAFYYCSRMRNTYFKGNAPTVVMADTESSSFGPYMMTLNYIEGKSGWTDSSAYDEVTGKWMGYPISVWEYVEEKPLVAVYGKITTYNPSIITTVTLTHNGETVYTYTTEALEGTGKLTQDFSIDEVEAGVYELVVTKAGHLSYTVTGIVVEDVDVLVDGPLVLITGDVNGDGRVDLKDITALTSSNTYGRSYSDAATKEADVNGDGCFDLKDLSIIASESNYGKAPIVVEY